MLGGDRESQELHEAMVATGAAVREADDVFERSTLDLVDIDFVQRYMKSSASGGGSTLVRRHINDLTGQELRDLRLRLVAEKSRARKIIERVTLVEEKIAEVLRALSEPVA